MYIANYCKCVPDEHWNHNPNVANKNGWTVAMYLANKGVMPPK